MTDQNGFGALAVAEPHTAVLAVDGVDESGADNRRKLALAGAVAGVVVLLLAAFFLLKGGGGDTAAPLPAHVVPPASDQATHTGQVAADKPVKLPKSYKDPVGRDPFKALYTAPSAPDGGEGKVSGSQDSSTDTVTPSSDPSAGSTPGTVTVPTTGTDGSTAGDFAPVWIELVSVKGTKTASFVIGYSNGKKSTTTAYGNVAVPTDGLRTTFAGVFALLSIQDGTATVQFGDGTPFDLSRGFANRHLVG